MKFTNTISLLTAALFCLVGCDLSDSSDDNGNGTTEKPVEVVMQIQSSTANKMNTLARLSVDSLTQVKLVVDELELESANSDDSLDFEIEDYVVDLPLDGSEIVLATADVREGRYDEFELEIDSPDEDSDVQDPDLVEGPDDDQRYSVYVRGVHNGAEFTYRSQVELELELDLDPPLEITESGPSYDIKIYLDPYSWFVDSSGAVLDPNDPANRERIDENIEDSFESEVDDDDDDDDDD